MRLCSNAVARCILTQYGQSRWVGYDGHISNARLPRCLLFPKSQVKGLLVPHSPFPFPKLTCCLLGRIGGSKNAKVGLDQVP